MSQGKIATNMLGRRVTLAPGLEHVWLKAWVDSFDTTKYHQDANQFLELMPKTASGEPLPATVVAVWKDDEGGIKIAAEMSSEPVAEDAPNRGGQVREFWVSHVKLVPQGR